MKTEFIPIDYDYFDFEGKNYARIIGRDEKGRRVCLIDSCPVYLWAILEDKLKDRKIKKITDRIKKIKLNIKGRQTKVEKIELHEKNFLGKPVKALKIFVTNYKDLHDIADRLNIKGIEKRRGYDLGFITHYIIEKKLTPLNWYEITGKMLNKSKEFGGMDMAFDVDLCLKLGKFKKLGKKEFSPKVLAYDIECDELKIGEGEILMISLVGNRGDFKKVLTWKKTTKEKPSYVEYVKDEKELLEKFVEEVKKTSPDFLVGYFSDGFDLPYLRARAEKFRVNLSLGLDNSQPKFYRGAITTGKIKGIIHIDLLRFIQTSYSQYMQSETLSLNEVAREFLGDEKKDFKMKHSSKIDSHEWKDYYEYSLHDSVLTYGLFEKFWPDLLEFTRTIREPIFDVSRNGLSKQVESYILHNLEKFDEIPEKRPIHEEISKRRRRQSSEGAFVFQPEPGLYKDIVMFDFTSMHTSIIVSFNLSKETLLEKKEKNCFESPELEFEGRKTRFYFSKKPGFFPLLAKEIFEKRKQFKEEYKKNPNLITRARSNAFKLLSASVHGYVAFFGARYFSAEASHSILAFVRKLNKEAIEKTKKAGYRVIYADTDSVAFTLDKKTKKQTTEFIKKLNSRLPGIMELELEGFYKRGIWVTTRAGKIGAKKKYALIDSKGNLKIRGFETVRRDWCFLARKVQNKIIRLILKEGNEKKSLEYLKEIIKKIKNREVDREELIIRTQLKKPLSEYKAISPHVIAARKIKEKEIPVSQGNLIEYFIAESKPGKKKKLVRERVKLPGEKGRYDVEYYLERQILPAVENIFQVFNIDIREVIEGKKQTRLCDFEKN